MIAIHLLPEDDHERLVALLHDADEDDDRIRRALRDPANAAYRLAESAHGTVGAAVIRWEAAASEIVYLAVDPARRGQGIGRAAIAAVITEAQTRGSGALLVGTANASLGNLAFYQKCGFRIDAVRKDAFADLREPAYENGIPIRDLILLRLEIA